MGATAAKEFGHEGVDETGPASHLDDISILNKEAAQASAAEHSMSLWRGLKAYRKAAVWSALISMTVIMEGYDTQLLANFWGYTAFRKKFGKYSGEEHGYQISSGWQAGINDLNAIGNLIGALLNGWLTSRYGHRMVLMISLAWLTAAIFVVFFAPNIAVLLTGEFLCNLPWGVFATTGPAYAAEVTPLALRGYLTAYINLCWCIGQLIAGGVLKGLVSNVTDWGYKIPLAIQWVWPVPLLLCVWAAPESPWFLVRTGQLESAKKSLVRLSQPGHDVDHNAAIALMVIDGSALCYSGTFFYEQAGLSTQLSYNLGFTGTALASLSVVISWFYISRFGRRRIWLYGLCMLLLCLSIVGILACIEPQTKKLGLAQSIFCILWLCCYSMSIGPIVYTIVAEIGSSRLRTQTIVLGRSAYYIINLISGVLQPYFMSPTAWNLQGKTAFFWAGLSLLMTVWGWFRLPETKDRTFEELDIRFHCRLPARKFATHQISPDDLRFGG